jgi:stress response protein YsnF
MARSPSPQDNPQPGAETAPVTEDADHSGPAPKTDEVVPLAEETLDVDKRERITGKVRVKTETDTVEELARATLQTETVEVTRVKVDRVVDAPPSVRTENGVMIVPVVEEIAVVEKRLVLKEELHIRRQVATEEIEVPIALRKQRAVVERFDRAEPED